MDNAHVFRSTQSYRSCVLTTPLPVSRKNSMKRGFPMTCAATIPSSTVTRTKGQTITRASSQRQQATVQIDTTRLLGISRSNSWHSAVFSRDASIHGAYFPSTALPKTCPVYDTMDTPRSRCTTEAAKSSKTRHTEAPPQSLCRLSMPMLQLLVC